MRRFSLPAIALLLVLASHAHAQQQNKKGCPDKLRAAYYGLNI